MYFDDDVENAIIRFNSEELTPRQKNKLFETEIWPAFNEMVQNIIYASIKNERPYYSDVSYDDLKYECISHLYEKIGGFEPSRGRAFSYFNHIGTRWMIGQSQSAYAKIQARCELDEIDLCRDLDAENRRDDDRIELQEFITYWAESCNSKLDTLFKKKRDRQIANAVFNLFINREYIDIYKKKALYILVREQFDVSTHQITKVVNQIRDLYTNMYQAYLKRKKKYGL
jgi:hypothetical protein